MPLKPPKGHGRVIATRPVPARVVVATVGAAVLAFAVLFVLNLTGAADALGPLKYGLFGLVGAPLVLVPRYSSYAAGSDWFRRGDSWVVTTQLTATRVDGQKLRLRDRGGRKVTVPLDVLAEAEGLFNALAGGVRASQASGMEVDQAARALFTLPADDTAG